MFDKLDDEFERVLKEQKNDDGNNDDSNDVMLIFLIRRDDIDIKQKDDIQLLANM